MGIELRVVASVGRAPAKAKFYRRVPLQEFLKLVSSAALEGACTNNTKNARVWRKIENQTGVHMGWITSRNTGDIQDNFRGLIIVVPRSGRLGKTLPMYIM